MADDHHSAYLANAVAALPPVGRERARELLGQLVEAAGDNERVVRFAMARLAEVDAGRACSEPEPASPPTLSELNDLIGGFISIRDQEPLDDVADWANAVVALLEDERRDARES